MDQGFYMRPRTDRAAVGEISRRTDCMFGLFGRKCPDVLQPGQFEGWRGHPWYKIFSEMTTTWNCSVTRRRWHVPIMRCIHAAGGEWKLIEYAKNTISSWYVRTMCTLWTKMQNPTGLSVWYRKRPGRPNRMLYTKQEWMKTREEMNSLCWCAEALGNTVEICDKVEFYSIDHAPIIPTFAIPEDFGTGGGYRKKFTEKDLFDEFTRDENGNVVMDEDCGEGEDWTSVGYESISYQTGSRLSGKTGLRRSKTTLWREPVGGGAGSVSSLSCISWRPWVSGILLDCAGLYQCGTSSVGCVSRSGTWFGGRFGGNLLLGYYADWPDSIRFAVLSVSWIRTVSLYIDVDFDDDGRGRVLNWVTEKYGQEKVAHIITYGTMATKVGYQGCGRVQNSRCRNQTVCVNLIPDKLPDKTESTECHCLRAELWEAEVSRIPVLRDTIKLCQNAGR